MPDALPAPSTLATSHSATPARDFTYIYEDFRAALLRAVVSGYAGPAAADFTAAVRGQYLLELTA